jgi:glycosyltransferase involved in cell wall biosynthesis
LLQKVVVRRGALLHDALSQNNFRNVEVLPVANSAIAAIRATSGADLVHIHEGRTVTVGAVRSLLGTPFVITRRVLKPPKDHFFTRWCYRRANRIATVSSAVAKTMRAYAIATPVNAIYDCIDVPASDPVKVREIREDLRAGLIVGNVAELDDETKGQCTILDVARRLQHMAPDIVFVLIGRGKDEAGLRSEAEQLPNVRSVGWSDRLSDYYAAMDLFVFPSGYEALGSAALEAMSFGLPVIASSVGGLPEIVTPGVNGYLVDAGESGALASRVSQLADDPVLRDRLGRNALATAAAFSPDAIAEQYHEFYLRAIYGVSWRWPKDASTRTRSESL